MKNTNISVGGLEDDEAPLEDEFSFDDSMLPVLDLARAAATFSRLPVELSHGCLLVPLLSGNAVWSVFWIDCNTLCTS